MNTAVQEHFIGHGYGDRSAAAVGSPHSLLRYTILSLQGCFISLYVCFNACMISCLHQCTSTGGTSLDSGVCHSSIFLPPAPVATPAPPLLHFALHSSAPQSLLPYLTCDGLLPVISSNSCTQPSSWRSSSELVERAAFAGFSERG